MPRWLNPFPLNRDNSPERDYDGSSVSEESIEMDYDGSSQGGHSESWYDGGSSAYTTSTAASSDWEEEDAMHEPDAMAAMRKFQGQQALQPFGTIRKSVDPRKALEEPATKESSIKDDQHSDNDSYEIQIHQFEKSIPPVEKVQPTAIDIASLRESIIPLTQKRKELIKLREIIDTKANETPRQAVARVQSDFSRSLANLVDYLHPLRHFLKYIDSNYGADVLSYFIFALWMIMINFFTLGFTFFFALAPTIFWHDLHDGKAATVIVHGDRLFRAEDLIKGGNYLYDSFLHYGFYLSDAAVIFGGWTYDRTLGYLVSMGFLYMLHFVVIIYSLTKSYGGLVSAQLMGAKTKYCNTIFFLWEFGTRSREAIRLNMLNIRTTLYELLVSEKRRRSFRRSIHLKRFAINLAVLAVIVGVVTGIWFLLTARDLSQGYSTAYKVPSESSEGTTQDTSHSARTTLATIILASTNAAAKELFPVIIITAVNVFLPVLFNIATTYEEHGSYEREIGFSLVKSVLLNICTVGALFFYWLDKRTGQNFRTLDVSNKGCQAHQEVACWETDLSLKFYQLIIMYVIFEWALSLIFTVPIAIQRLMAKKKWTPVFQGSLLTQRIIYLQVITWFGSFYSPVICSLVLLATALTVLREALIVRYTKFYKSAPLGSATEGVQVIYCAGLLGSFLAATISVAFAITVYTPSNQCGPFRTLCPEPDIIVAAVGRVQSYSEGLYFALDLLITPAILIFLTFVLLVFVYYYHVKSEAYDELIPVLQNHLALEGKDQIALYLHEVETQNKRNKSRAKKKHHDNRPDRRPGKSTTRRHHASRPAVPRDQDQQDNNTARTRV